MSFELILPFLRPIEPLLLDESISEIMGNPPHSPIYTYGAAFMAVILTGFFVYCRFTFGTGPLQRFYTPIYIRSSVATVIGTTRKDNYRMLMMSGRGMKRNPTSMVKLKSKRKKRSTRSTFTPVAIASSGENRVNTSWSRSFQIAAMMKATAKAPRRKPSSEVE